MARRPLLRRTRNHFTAGMVLMALMFAGFIGGATFDSTTLWRVSATVGLVGVGIALLAIWEDLHRDDD